MLCLTKHCEFSRVPHDFFTFKKHQIFYVSFKKNNFDNCLREPHYFYSRSEGTQLHFHFIINAIFSYLIFTYFLIIFIFFFHSFRKGILSLSFINYLHFTILYTCKHVINQARHTSQLVAVYIKMK